MNAQNFANKYNISFQNLSDTIFFLYDFKVNQDSTIPRNEEQKILQALLEKKLIKSFKIKEVKPSIKRKKVKSKFPKTSHSKESKQPWVLIKDQPSKKFSLFISVPMGGKV